MVGAWSVRVTWLRICVTWLIHMCDMPHSHVWRDSFFFMWCNPFIRVTWLVHMCDMTRLSAVLRKCSARSVCVTWLVYLCDMAYSHVWHGPFKRVKWILMGQRAVPCVTWLISYVWHDSYTSVTWLNLMCVYVWHDSYTFVMWHISIREVTHSYEIVCMTWLTGTFEVHDDKCSSHSLMHMCDMTHCYVFIHVTWLIRMCDVTHSLLGGDSFIHAYMRDMTHKCFWGA